MKNIIELLNWRAGLKNISEYDAIDDDFVLFDSIVTSNTPEYPFKLDVTIAMICIKGTMSGNINLKPFTSASPGLAIILPDQILEHGFVSEDFSGLIMIMSRRYTDSLNIQVNLTQMLSIRNNPYTTMTDDELVSIMAFYSILQRTVRKKDNPYRMEIVQCLVKAFFYSAGYHKLPDAEKKSKNEMVAEQFLNHVEAYYKEKRGVEFYANKLCLTPKYLSKLVKESSGQSANEWIDSYVILEAKALLKSTNKNIQQISDELNFPSQSFFGKYFKRQVGVSPKEYKRS